MMMLAKCLVVSFKYTGGGKMATSTDIAVSNATVFVETYQDNKQYAKFGSHSVRAYTGV